MLELLLRALHPLDARSSPRKSGRTSHRNCASIPRACRCRRIRAPATSRPMRGAAAEIEWFKGVISQLRRIRSEMNLAPSEAIPAAVCGRQRAGSRARREVRRTDCASPSSRASAGSRRAEAETRRGRREIVGELKPADPASKDSSISVRRKPASHEGNRAAQAEIAKCNSKLGTATFVANAPPAVVEQERPSVLQSSATRWRVCGSSSGKLGG